MQPEATTMDADSAIRRNGYLCETQRRMAVAIWELKGIQRSGEGDMSGVVGHLREQEAASRLGGFAPISCLCQTLEDCLTLDRLLHWDRGNPQAPAASMVATGLDGCRAIQLHAEAVDKTTNCLRHQDGAGGLPSWLRRHLGGQLPPQA